MEDSFIVINNTPIKIDSISDHVILVLDGKSISISYKNIFDAIYKKATDGDNVITYNFKKIKSNG